MTYYTWVDRLMMAFLIVLIVGASALIGYAAYRFITPEIVHGSVIKLSVVGNEAWAVVEQADGTKRSVAVGDGYYIQLSLGDTCDFNVNTFVVTNCVTEGK